MIMEKVPGDGDGTWWWWRRYLVMEMVPGDDGKVPGDREGTL